RAFAPFQPVSVMNMLAPDLSIEQIEAVVVRSDGCGTLRLPRDDHDRPIETVGFTKRKCCKWLPPAGRPEDRRHRQSRHCATSTIPIARHADVAARRSPRRLEQDALNRSTAARVVSPGDQAPRAQLQ